MSEDRIAPCRECDAMIKWAVVACDMPIAGEVRRVEILNARLHFASCNLPCLGGENLPPTTTVEQLQGYHGKRWCIRCGGRWERVDRAVGLLVESVQAIVEALAEAPFEMAREFEEGAPKVHAARERLGAALIAVGKARLELRGSK